MYGKTYNVVHHRIVYLHWTIDRALKTPTITRYRFKSECKKIDEGIEGYVANMARYYTKEHRHRSYKQLRKDFEEIGQRQHLRVA